MVIPTDEHRPITRHGGPVKYLAVWHAALLPGGRALVSR